MSHGRGLDRERQAGIFHGRAREGLTSSGKLVATLLLMLLLKGSPVQRAILTLQVRLTKQNPRWRHNPGIKPRSSHVVLLDLLLVVMSLLLALRVTSLVKGEAVVVLLLLQR